MTATRDHAASRAASAGEMPSDLSSPQAGLKPPVDREDKLLAPVLDALRGPFARAGYASETEAVGSEAASRRLADLGFLAAPDLPDRPGPAYLLVALRDQPTFGHYDPERVEYWVTVNGRGVRQSLTRSTRLPLDATLSWGMLRIFDRLPVTNEYLTFGGHVSAAEVDGATIVVFVSPVPMLRRGGHSQIWDEGSDELAAFFARLVAAVDVRPRIEPRLAALDPYVRYAMFLGEVVARYRTSPNLRSLNPGIWTLLSAEASRMRRDHPAAWQAGEQVLVEIGLP